MFFGTYFSWIILTVSLASCVSDKLFFIPDYIQNRRSCSHLPAFFCYLYFSFRVLSLTSWFGETNHNGPLDGHHSYTYIYSFVSVSRRTFSMSCLPMEVSLLYYKPRRVFSLHVPSCCCRRIVRMPIRTVGEKYFSKRETEGRNRLWVMSGITPLLYSPLLIFSLSLISFFPYFDRHMVRSLWEMYTVTLIAIIHTHTHTHTPDDECTIEYAVDLQSTFP